MILTDTILALSSPPAGSGLRAIIRLSGPGAHRLAGELVEIDSADSGRYLSNVNLRHWPPNNRLASLLRFHAPKSFTGQDIAEIHLPNSPGLVRWTIDHLLQTARTLETPARMADPGEFSARAFFNGKLDLTEAEGIAATINAQNEAQLRAAASLREGDVHHWIVEIAEKLVNLLALVEAGIDFVDEEDVHFIDDGKLSSDLEQLGEAIHSPLANSIRMDRLDDVPTAVFIGEPNVGKSSLVNALAGLDRSIVSPVAGTTRDALDVTMTVNGRAIRLLDVPGKELPSDELRQKMMEVRTRALLDADLLVEVVAADQRKAMSLSENASYARPCITVQNKAELLSESERAQRGDLGTFEDLQLSESWQMVSAKTGLHIDLLRERLATLLLREETLFHGRLALNHRHREILLEVKQTIWDAASLAREGISRRHPELLSAELRQALDLLGQITGTISPDDVLGRIFSTFCIGK